jgi:phage tail-like protein
MTSDTPTFLLLDPVLGWRSSMDHLSPVPGVGLAVDCVPGQPARFAVSLADRLTGAVALAVDPNYQRLYVLDAHTQRVQTMDLGLQRQSVTQKCDTQYKDDPSGLVPKSSPAQCGDLEFSVIRAVGGEGTGAREFLNARGLAVLLDGALVVADTGNNQVKIFSALSHTLLAVWGTGKAGKGALEFHHPRKVVADQCGLIYVADAGNGRIQRIQRDGTPREPITGLLAPLDLAVNLDRVLAVVDQQKLLIFPKGAASKSQDFDVPSGSCVTFDAGGAIYVGTSTGLVYKFVVDGKGGFRPAGIGVTGQDAAFLDLIWIQNDQLLGILLPKCEAKSALWTMCTCAAFTTASDTVNGGSYLGGIGTLITDGLDSEIERCCWHRIALDATIPSGTVIEVATQTSADPFPPDAPFQDQGFSYSSAGQQSKVCLTGHNPDCLVQSAPGRYLRIRVRLLASGLKSPVLRGIRVYFPRDSYLQYLPTVYQEDDESRLFLERFLSIFQTTFDALDDNIDKIWMMFDPASVPEKWFSWLASWIELPLNPLWFKQGRKNALQAGRTALKKAGKIYPKRGTRAGIEELITEYTGVSARLVEHYRLRQLIVLTEKKSAAASQASYVPQFSAAPLCTGTRLFSRDYYQRLQVGVYSRIGYFRLTGEPEPGIESLAWGANEFSVFFDCEPYEVGATQSKVRQLVEREKPAHARANYCPVFPRLRVGVQSTLGIDTRIGVVTPLLLGTTGTLGYDSILGCSAAELSLQRQQLSSRPQLDVTSRLQ